jgi:PKD repeat protein
MNAVHTPIVSLLLLALMQAPMLQAQSAGCSAVDDAVTITLGQPFSFNVTANDAPTGCPVLLRTPSTCLRITPDGQLALIDPNDATCCGKQTLIYEYDAACIGGGLPCFASVEVTIRCPKPDCFLVNLLDYQGGSAIGGPPPCAYACENSASTYFVPFVSGNAYSWSVLGGTFAPGANPAEIAVTWGSAGSGTVSVTITDPNAQSSSLSVCVEVLQSPVAAFSASDTTLCLGASVALQNQSTGANSYFWDFGDGNTSTMPSPVHTYGTPGTYTVVLYATRDNFDDLGNPLCCCTDSTFQTITVDSLPGPSIFCISTLCANDSAQYSTDAANCSSWFWSVSDAQGNPLPFSGQNTPSISVLWGNGPVGTVSLITSGCDSLYCDDTTKVVVPIITSTVNIDGPLLVCQNSTETYTIPKWISTLYTWSIGGGTILAGQGTNTVVVQWGPGPSSGTLSVQYASSFLSGLPGQEPLDCQGSANINVNIQPAFSISGPLPAVACANSSSVFSASPTDSYNWSISPAAAFSGNGTSTINVNWGSPGTHTITAVPVNPVYCNSLATTLISVVQPVPPDSILGESLICPGQTYTYFGQGLASGNTYDWTVTGGSPASFTGDPLVVTWNAVGPYGISLAQTQLQAPFCISAPISLSITPKQINGPLSLSGTGSCTNALGSYTLSPTQNPEAIITWSVSPALAGSVVAGQGTDSVQIQWNNTAGLVTLTATVELCGQTQTISQNINLTAALVPVISQIGILCPGVTATLDAGPGYSSYAWSNGSTAQTTTIAAGGAYSVQVLDPSGCPASATFNAVAQPGPVANLSPAGPVIFCLDQSASGSVTLKAQTNPGYSFQWFINGSPQALPPSQDTLVHTNTGVPASFSYYFVVTDANGCINTSNTVLVVQLDSCEGCTPEPHTADFSGANQFPNCAVVDFTPSTSGPVTVTGWNFNNPFGNANTATLPLGQHTYAQAGSYLVTMFYQVPAAAPDTGFCSLNIVRPVDIPLAALFTFSDSCQKVQFADQSTFLPGNSILSWFWTFGDANSSTLQNPQHTYAAPGTYFTTLTITSASGCTATFSDSVTVLGNPTPGIAINPNPACVGEPVSFSGSGSNILSWLWDFGNGATNAAQNPQQSYLQDSLYTITLSVINDKGCLGSSTTSLLVFPAVPEDTITYAPSLTICEGDSTTLFAPAGSYTYLWSNGSTAASITTGTAGMYSVSLTDPNGCSYTTDAVEVVVIPKPPAVISGNTFICDNGCLSLSAPLGFGFTYQWLDNLGNPLPSGLGQTLQVCDTNLLAGYAVVVTNANSCSDTSSLTVVSTVASPAFSVVVSGDSCAGSPNVLSVNPIQPGILYSWSQGGSGPSIAVQQAGTYTAFGTDTATGCTSSASAIIHPLPDLCLVPAGCYEACNPDTLCGPPGLALYQWNLNGLPLPGETGQCLLVTSSGTYSLTGTTSFGCSLTSDDLHLDLIPCDGSEPLLCDGVDAEALPATEAADSCCWNLSLSNSVPNTFIGIRLDALGGASLNYGGSNAGWLNIGSSSTSVELLHPSLGFVPTASYSGSLSDVASFCLSGFPSNTQQVVISWLVPGPGPLGYLIECTDTLDFFCKPEGCVEIVYDTIYCDGDTIKYEFYLENQSFSFDILSVRLNVDPALDVSLSPNPINIPPIPPLGVGGPFTLCITGPDAVFGNSLSFNLTVHNEPIVDSIEQTYCCTDTVVIVVPFPECDPCELTGVVAEPVEGEGCCYQLTLVNQFAANYFSGIQTEILTPGASFGSITGAFPLGWVYLPQSPSSIHWSRVPLGSSVPLDSVALPPICFAGTYGDTLTMVVHWLVPGLEADSIACSDTLTLVCTPTLTDCAALLNPAVVCESPGNYVLQFQVVNNSGVNISQVVFTGLSPSGITLSPVAVSLAQGDTSGVLTTFLSGPGAVAGAQVCFNLTLKQLVAGLELECCTTDSAYCLVLPPCEAEPCEQQSIQNDLFVVNGPGIATLDILANDNCQQDGFLIASLVSIVSGPSNGTIININPLTGAIAYQPNPGFNGLDCFTYEVCCEVPALGGLVCCQAQVCMDVNQGEPVCDASLPPTGLQALVLPSVVALSWNPIPQSVACQIQGQRLVPPGPTPVQNIIGFQPSSFNLPITLAGPGSTWRWRVRCACSIDPRITTPYSGWDTFSIPLARQLAALPELTLFPNPAGELLNLDLRHMPETTVEIRVLDAQGRIQTAVEHAVNPEGTAISLSLEGLPGGLYSVMVEWPGDRRSARFVKVE